LVAKPSLIAESWVGAWLPPLPSKPSLPLVALASVALIGFIIAKNLFLVFVSYAQARIINGQRVRLCDRMFRIYQAAPYEWHLQRSSSDLLRNIQFDTGQVLSGVLMPLFDVVMCVAMIMGIGVILLISTPGIALMCLLMMAGGVFLIIRVLRKQLHKTGEILHREAAKSILAIQQAFGALVDARLIGCEAYLSKVYRKSLLNQSSATCERAAIERSTPYAIETLAIFGLLIIFVVVIYAADSLTSAMLSLTLVAAATVRLKQVTGKLAGAVNQINSNRPFISGILDDVRELNALAEKARAEAPTIETIACFERLRLTDVTYSYPNTDSPALRDITVELTAGESLAFVGPTGCGKSTLINVILGLLKPQRGVILVNDFDIRRVLASWHAHVAYVPQFIYLIDDTIRANIAFGIDERDVDKERLAAAVQAAQLDTFIDGLPEGLNTIVGERGVRLSGGQRQRLGVARALYQDRDVLILDEATSALDTVTEEKLMQAIRELNGRRTLIIISHRLSTVGKCDRLCFLVDGRIEGSGTFGELERSSAKFSQLAAAAVAGAS
jgi:ATP-binding cassette subfamily C protein